MEKKCCKWSFLWRKYDCNNKNMKQAAGIYWIFMQLFLHHDCVFAPMITANYLNI